MKHLLLMGLIAASSAAWAQAPQAPRDRMEADQAKAGAEAVRSEADEARARAELEKARAELDAAARKVAELSTKLAHDEQHNFIWVGDGGPRRAVLGVQIEDSGKEGARILNVSPGGAAEQAGLRQDDVIIALDGKSIAGRVDPGRAVVEHMRAVKPDQKVKVRVARDGKKLDFEVVARPMVAARAFNFRLPEGAAMGRVMAGAAPQFHAFAGFGPGTFGGMELASLTPKLGTYFGASEGVLVVQAPRDAAFQLEDGDVIQSIDGRKPEDGAHAMRILRSYKAGEKLTLAVLRQRKSLKLTITMPERPEFSGHGWDLVTPEPALPPLPPVPPVPGAPAGST